MRPYGAAVFWHTAFPHKKIQPSIPASQKISECYQKIWRGAPGQHTKVGVIYQNNAMTTYDDDIDYEVINAIIQGINPQDHIMVDASDCLGRFNAIGINDLSMAERTDIADVVKDAGLDYAVVVQVNPFARKERMSAFRYTLEMTSDIVVKIVDVQESKYLYSGRINEFAKHGTAVGGISNKSAVLKSLNLACPALTNIISSRIPKG